MKLYQVSLVAAFCLLLSRDALCQTATITDPPDSSVGSSLQIVCAVFMGSGGSVIYESPERITLLIGTRQYQNSRLSSSTNTTHKTYTLENLQRDDSGTMLTCSVGEFRSRVITLQVLYPPTVTLASSGDMIVAPGMDNYINFTVDANPPASTRVERVGSQAPVPTSFTATTDNVVVVANPSITDGGMYRYFASNSEGSAMVDFTVVVHFAPMFVTSFADGITCELSGPEESQAYNCIMLREASGSFNCQFQANPSGTIAYVLPQNSTTNISESRIISIDSADSASAGNYSCEISNTVLGQPRSATRSFTLFVGGPPVAVEDNAATVNEEGGTVDITWSYNGDTGIPVWVLITIQVLNSQDNVFTMTVPVGQNSLSVRLDTFNPSTSYRVVFTTMNVLETGQAREATFAIPRNTMPTPTGTSPILTTDSSTRTTVTSLATIALLLVCTLALL